MKNENHIPVPVEAAKEIAHKYGKGIVVILSFDPISGLVHTTTYGEPDLKHKQLAALWGDTATKAIGAELELKNTYEDFRNPIKVLENWNEWLGKQLAQGDFPAELLSSGGLTQLLKKYLSEQGIEK